LTRCEPNLRIFRADSEEERREAIHRRASIVMANISDEQLDRLEVCTESEMRKLLHSIRHSPSALVEVLDTELEMTLAEVMGWGDIG
jgi:hypothetical protein